MVGGLHISTIDQISWQIYTLGFNCVRLQWSLEMYYQNPPLPYQAVAAMPELAGTPALDVYIEVVNALAKYNIMVIIDNHVSDAIWCCGTQDGNGLWYTSSYSEEMWIEAWKGMVRVFQNQPFVIGADLRNELRVTSVNGFVRTPTWGSGNANTDWQIAASKVSREIQAINPNLLILIQGINYGQRLEGARNNPIRLNVPNKLVYCAHDYSWFHNEIDWSNQAEATYQQYKEKLDSRWGFVFLESNQPYTAPMWVSEIGTSHNAQGMTFYWSSILRYISENDLNFAVWPIDGTQSRGEGREFGAEEIFGVLNVTWNGVAYWPHYNSIYEIMNKKK